ncbi:hypothetical protein [Metabacillus sp. SLBN-84]
MKKMLKDVKILIPDIPVTWLNRTRSGHTNTWTNPDTKHERSLEPPEQGLYAVRFEDGWYWVCGCEKCLGRPDVHSYIVCHNHDRCLTCHTHREDLTDIPWGMVSGFQCRTCRETERAKKKEVALANAAEMNHSELDCSDEDAIICPTCASVNESEDLNEPGGHNMTCGVCDTPFKVEIEYEIRYTATKIKDERSAVS